jgi:hypothetical protein
VDDLPPFGPGQGVGDFDREHVRGQKLVDAVAKVVSEGHGPRRVDLR